MGWYGKKAAGRTLDGRLHDEFPDEATSTDNYLRALPV